MSSTNRNADSVTNQGEFVPRRQRDEPLTTKGHQPGVQVGNDAAPEFHIETLPAGTAPADRTFQPQTTNEVPGQADNEQTLRQHGKESTYTSAGDTLSGATSSDVHTGFGHPGQGQTSSELRHGGQHTSKREGAGLQGVGSGSGGDVTADERYDPTQRGLERDDAASGQRGDKADQSAATKIPETAESLAAERD